MLSNIITFIIEGLIAAFFLNQTFINTKSRYQKIAAFIIGYGILTIISFAHIIPLNLAAFTIINFLIVYIIYTPVISGAIFYAIIMTCVMGFSELLFSSIADNFQISPMLNDKSIFLFFILSKSSYFILLLVVSRLTHNNDSSRHNDSKNISFANVILIVITLLTLVELFCLYHIMRNAVLPAIDSNMIILCCICTIIIDITLVWFMDYMTARNNELLQLHLQLQSEIERNSTYQLLETSYENQQIMIHDMKNHLNTIMNLISDTQSDDAMSYINSLITSREFNTKTKYCTDTRLNTIFNRYIMMADSLSIKCNIDAYNSNTCFIKSSHLTSMICNLLDNAIAACSNAPDTHIDIKITPVASSSTTFISISNTCTNKPLTDEAGNLITSNQDTIHHGYGLKSVSKIVSEYNGNIQTHYDDENKVFCVLLTLEDR